LVEAMAAAAAADERRRSAELEKRRAETRKQMAEYEAQRRLAFEARLRQVGCCVHRSMRAYRRFGWWDVCLITHNRRQEREEEERIRQYQQAVESRTDEAAKQREAKRAAQQAMVAKIVEEARKRQEEEEEMRQVSRRRTPAGYFSLLRLLTAPRYPTDKRTPAARGAGAGANGGRAPGRGGDTPPMTPAYLDPRSGETFPLDTPRWCGTGRAPLFITDLPGITRAQIDTSTRSLWRYAWSDGDLAPVAHLVVVGLTWEIADLHRLGIGFATGEPSRPGQQRQTSVEVFYRHQVNANIVITPDLQLAFGDDLGRGPGWLALAGLRIGITF
jgi:hypothetical protein